MALRAPSRPGRPRRLTIERIVEAAIDVVESRGVKALTMEAVARALGVGTMTLYGYVRSRDDLIDRAIASIVAEAPSPPVPKGDWIDKVVAHCLSLRRWLTARPALFLLDAERPYLSDAAAATYEAELTSLMKAGFRVEDAAVLRHAISTQLFGQIRWEEVRRSAQRSGVLEANRERANAPGTPAPVTAAAERIASIDPEALYERSLRALLAGFEATRVRRKPRRLS